LTVYKKSVSESKNTYIHIHFSLIGNRKWEVKTSVIPVWNLPFRVLIKA